MTEAGENWLPAAKLLRPQGRRGELLAEPHTSFTVFASGRTLWLAPGEHADPLPAAERQLEDAWQPTGKNAGRLVLKLAGIDSISAAEALVGQYLLMRASDLPALEPDTFRVRDLVGCSVFDHDRPVGTVVDVQFPIAADGHTRLEDAPDLLAVQPAFGDGSSDVDGSSDTEREPVLVPFVRAWLIEVDLPARRIAMQLPPGLLDTDTDPGSSDTLKAG